MLYCKKCGVSVEGNPDYCPLCQGELSGTALGAQKYPAIQKKPNRLAFALKLAFMITLAAVVICAYGKGKPCIGRCGDGIIRVRSEKYCIR